MRLKKLILQGFKSFADRTEFVFDSAITGIVGPNGCGKSNVVDGFKWVLGEQSAKSLRGEAMLDVIFNGSGGRKPANLAEVTLVFENPRRDDGSRHLSLDLDEVSVGRRLYRDGTSEYTQNNNVARLKDIRELFMDTGVGVDAYSVIEQGRVAALLEANPEERRLIFEEAAGISKFKQRKKEAQRKLEKVDQNLLRVNDIVEEVEKRLRSVKLQAGKARNYQEYAVRLNELRLQYALQEYHTLHSQVSELQGRQEDGKFCLEDAFANLSRSQNALAEKRESFDVLSKAKQSAEYELVQKRAGIEAARQLQTWAEQQLRQIADQQEQFAADSESVAERLADADALFQSENESLADLTSDLQQRRTDIESHQADHRDGQLRLNNASRDIEQHKSAILDLMRRLAGQNSRLGAIEIEKKNIASQQGRLSERQSVIRNDLEQLAAKKLELQATLEETLAYLADQQRQQEALRERAKQLGQQIATLADHLGAAKEHRSGLVSRQKLLKDLEAKREGVSEGVKSVLRQREMGQPFAFVRGLVADVLRVDVEHATLIEAALDGRDQWLVSDAPGTPTFIHAAADELEGRVNVLCTADLPGDEVPAYDWNSHGTLVRLASDLVRFEPRDAELATHLLGRTIAVDDLAEADVLRRLVPAGWRFVTYAGEVVEGDGTVRAGPLTAAMGLISRRAELEVLDQQIADVDARITTLSGDLSRNSAAAKTLEEETDALRNEIYRANTAKVEVLGKLQQMTDRSATLGRELPLIEQELENYESQVGKLAAEQATLQDARAALEADQAERERLIQELTSTQQTLVEESKMLAERLTAARVELGQIQEKQLACQQHVQRLTAQRAELGQQAERLARSAEGLLQRQAQVRQEQEAAQQSEAVLFNDLQTLTAQAQDLSQRAAEAGEAMRTYHADVERYRAIHGEIEQSLHVLEVSLGQSKVRFETLLQRTTDELQLDLPAKYAAFSLPAEDGTPGAGYEPAELDWDEIAVEIKELKEKIQRLGNVNLDSLQEMEELEQRSQFFSQQLTDLSDSKKQLEELIDKINIESGLRFEQTLTAVREHFQGMFRKLFGGGKADIFLETEIEMKPMMGPDGQMLPAQIKKVDPLEAGIEILAHPPGKKPATINQLSGGEKAMTCIALLMSIFKSKPSPFCILDEVDAPLDEANNQRFGMIIQEFLAISQFIVITHHKRTMQICDLLYGVTMQEQGVSKRVAVKFDQVDSQGRISETAAA